MVEQEMITKALAEYHVTDAALAKLNEEYMALTVKSVADVQGYNLVHAARMNIKGKRVEVEKTRKKLKEDALEYGRAVDGEAKRITALLAPIESHLESQEKIVDDEKARIKAEAEAKEAARIKARLDKLYALGCVFRGQFFELPFTNEYTVMTGEVTVSSDEQFAKIMSKFQTLVGAENERIAQEATDKKAEEERLAKVQKEQEVRQKELDAQFEKQQAAAAKLKADQRAVEAEKKRLADEETARLKAIQDEKDRVEAERVRAEEMEKAKKAAAEKALRDKAVAEEKAKKQAERVAARRPDKEKLILLIIALKAHPFPAMKTPEGKEILAEFETAYLAEINTLNENTEAL